MSIPNSPIVNAGLLYVTGLGISKTAAKQITMQLGAARDSTNINDILLGATSATPDEPTTPGVPLVINGAAVGANGVDIAAIVASSFYAVYIIGDSTRYQATAGLLSLSATTPSLPFGYDMYRRVGWVLTDGSADILQFWQFGSGSGRMYYYDVGISITSIPETSFTPLSLATAVPPIATEVLFNSTYTPNSATNTAQFLPYGSSASNGIIQIGFGVAAAQVSMVTIPCELNTTAPTILYKMTSGSDTLALLVAGFKDNL